MTANVEIRSGSDADLDALVVVLGQRHYFTDHLARQQDGRGVLLVAWLDRRPVGDGFLSWVPADHPEIRRHLPGVPELSHLEVVGPLWGQGIGTALIRAAEDSARQVGHDRLILAVGVDNPPPGGCMSDWGMSTGITERSWGPGWSAINTGRR